MEIVQQEDNGMNSLPSTKLVDTRGIMPTLSTWITDIVLGLESGTLEEGELPLVAKQVLVHNSSSPVGNYDPEYDRDDYIFVEETNEVPCDIEGKLSMEQFSDVVCPAMGRTAKLSVVLMFRSEDAPTTILLQVASKDPPSSQPTLTEVAKLVPQLMKHGLVSCCFVSNSNELAFYPDLPIVEKTIKLLVKTDGLEIILECFALGEKPQQYLNATCKACLLFANCTFNGGGAILMSKPNIALKIGFKGQYDSHFPALVHLATAVEHRHIENVSLEMLQDPYKLDGPEDSNNLKRFCDAAIDQGHKVTWGDAKQTRFGDFATMPDDDQETINMGQFDFNNLGSAGTRKLVATYFKTREWSLSASITPAIEKPVDTKDEDISGVVKSDSTDSNTENVAPALVNPNPGLDMGLAQLKVYDGKCHGIKANGQANCGVAPKRDKHVCHIHIAQDGQV